MAKSCLIRSEQSANGIADKNEQSVDGDTADQIYDDARAQEIGEVAPPFCAVGLTEEGLKSLCRSRKDRY